jgi:hypothetical protein
MAQAGAVMVPAASPANCLATRLCQPPQGLWGNVAIDVVIQIGAGHVAGKGRRRHRGGNGGTPEPAAEQLVGQTLGPLWPQRRRTQATERLQGDPTRGIVSCRGPFRVARHKRQHHRDIRSEPT